jgi:hypothetical protein
VFVMQDDIAHGRRTEQEAIASHITFEDSTTLELYHSVRKQIYRLKRRVLASLSDMSKLQHMVALYQDTATARISAAHEVAMSNIAGAVMSTNSTSQDLKASSAVSSQHQTLQRPTTDGGVHSSQHRPSTSYAFARPAAGQGQQTAADGDHQAGWRGVGKVFNSSMEIERNQRPLLGSSSSGVALTDGEGGSSGAAEPSSGPQHDHIARDDDRRHQHQRADHILCQHSDSDHLFSEQPHESHESPTSQPRRRLRDQHSVHPLSTVAVGQDRRNHARHQHQRSPSRKDIWIGAPPSQNLSSTSIAVSTDDEEYHRTVTSGGAGAGGYLLGGGGGVNVSTASSAATSSKAALLEAIRAASTAVPLRASLRSSGGALRRSVDPLDLDQLLSASTVHSPSQYHGSPQHHQRLPHRSTGGSGGAGSMQNSLLHSDASLFSTLKGDSDLDRYMKWKADFTQRLAEDGAPAASTSLDSSRYRTQGDAAARDNDNAAGGDSVNVSSPTF